MLAPLNNLASIFRTGETKYSTLKRCIVHFKELPAVEIASMSIQWRQGKGYGMIKKTGYTDITLYVFLLSQTMGMCAA